MRSVMIQITRVTRTSGWFVDVLEQRRCSGIGGIISLLGSEYAAIPWGWGPGLWSYGGYGVGVFSYTYIAAIFKKIVYMHWIVDFILIAVVVVVHHVSVPAGFK